MRFGENSSSSRRHSMDNIQWKLIALMNIRWHLGADNVNREICATFSLLQYTLSSNA
jgi:hypothetical protein